MKFTDGYWQVREGMKPYYPAHVYDVEVEPDAMTVYAPTTKIVTRADTHDVSLLSIRFSAPMENVIRVQMLHHKGGYSTQTRVYSFQTTLPAAGGIPG